MDPEEIRAARISQKKLLPFFIKTGGTATGKGNVVASINTFLRCVAMKTIRTQDLVIQKIMLGKKKIKNLVNASQEFLFINPQWKPVSV